MLVFIKSREGVIKCIVWFEPSWSDTENEFNVRLEKKMWLIKRLGTLLVLHRRNSSAKPRSALLAIVPFYYTPRASILPSIFFFLNWTLKIKVNQKYFIHMIISSKGHTTKKLNSYIYIRLIKIHDPLISIFLSSLKE